MDFIHQVTEQLPLALGPSWLDPDQLIRTFGMLGVLVIVFVESGLMVGFFLPGDSLLFTAGLLSASDVLPPIWVLLITIPIAAIAGDQCGYWIGRRFGPPLFNRPDSRLFKREYVDQTAAFFEKHGPRAIILARFVPIVRAFVPVMAGTSKMHYRTFLTYDIVGGILWGAGVTTLGYFLGQIEFVKNNIEFMLIAIVLVSVAPVLFEIRKARKSAESHQKPEPFENPIDEEGEPIHQETQV
ncbi:MAG: VTT domain-containing protein [Solirubrobacterales bacterium]|nr:VTT domain-containing protein [Solirubrobacterales bacterium]HMT05021.1 VTT domain-containing protein [Solirubrobacterales bacterium]